MGSIRILVALLLVASVASCGGRSSSSAGSVTRLATASGPIATACLRAGRKAANSASCGCVQSVADFSLSSSDQRLGATFFADPQRAQDIRQSDSAGKEAFWQRWKSFGDQAAQLCG